MVQPLSLDLRVRVVAVARGMSRRQAAERFGVSAASAVRWCQLSCKQGDAKPRRQGGDRHSHRIEAHAYFILAACRTEFKILDLRRVFSRLASRQAPARFQTAPRVLRLAPAARGCVKPSHHPAYLSVNIRLMFHALVTRLHSPRALSRPRIENCRKPSTDLMMPNTGSGVCLRSA